MIRKDLPIRINLTDGGLASSGSEITLYQNPIISPVRSDLGDPAIIGVIIPPPAIVTPPPEKQFAFSVAQRIVTGYNGSIIRVRRSSDNATQNIGLSGSNLDTTSLLSFVGAGDGFVTRIFDQFNGMNAFQDTASKQAKIVNSGSLITIGSDPALLFDGVDDGYFLPELLTTNHYTINTTFEPRLTLTASSDQYIFHGTLDNKTTGLYAGNFTGSITGETIGYFSARFSPFVLAARYTTVNVSDAQNIIITANHNTSTVTATRNGIALTNFGTFDNNTSPCQIESIGGNRTLTGSFFDGKLRDLYFEDLN
jgi:hypothetical protein